MVLASCGSNVGEEQVDPVKAMLHTHAPQGEGSWSPCAPVVLR